MSLLNYPRGPEEKQHTVCSLDVCNLLWAKVSDLCFRSWQFCGMITNSEKPCIVCDFKHPERAEQVNQ